LHDLINAGHDIHKLITAAVLDPTFFERNGWRAVAHLLAFVPLHMAWKSLESRMWPVIAKRIGVDVILREAVRKALPRRKPLAEHVQKVVRDEAFHKHPPNCNCRASVKEVLAFSLLVHPVLAADN